MSFMFQFSTAHFLRQGRYDGGISIKDIKAHGNFGIGAFHAFDGELIAIDGQFFHCQDGVCHPAHQDELLAWGAVCFFNSTASSPCIESLVYGDGKIQGLPPSCENSLVAMKIEGTFDDLNLITVPGQTKPYPPIHEIATRAKTFSHSKISGCIVGWFSPDMMGVIKQAGFHLHFISEDRQQGGHVLSFKAQNVHLSLEEMEGFSIQFFKNALNEK